MKKVIILLLILIIIFIIIELCCSYCFFENLHFNHKILKIEDEESLKKENISIETSNKEFDPNIQKLNNLENLIRKEIIEINKAYEKVDKETTKSYELKRDKLKKEEEDLKEKLKTEVTKVKQQFEINLSKIEDLLKTAEKIIKGIKIFEKEEKNMFKTLSYVSIINKNKKEMQSLFQELMKNLKISFIEEESLIKYEEYYFNGIPIPKDIEFKEIGSNCFKILWNIDNINLLNIDKKEIKYKLEIRKENAKEDFFQIYEGKDNNFLVNKLEKNTSYEVRICSFYNDINSNWSDIQKIQTMDFDSKILNETEKGKEFLEKLYEWTGFKRMELLYRGTRDGSGKNIFHNKCDNQGPTIILCQNEKGNIFGGYASISWTSDNKYHDANGSFLFTLTNIYNTAPTKFPNTQKYGNAVYHGSDRGPAFGGNHDLAIFDNYLNNKSSYASLGCSYPDILGKGNSVFSGDVNSNYFKLKELEVFKLLNTIYNDFCKFYI